MQNKHRTPMDKVRHATSALVCSHRDATKLYHGKPIHVKNGPHQQSSMIISRDELRVSVGPTWFVVFWWIVNGFRGCQIWFLYRMVWWYPKIQQQITIGALTVAFSPSVIILINWAFVLIILLQSLMLVQSVVYSLLARELTFTYQSPSGRWTPLCHLALGRFSCGVQACVGKFWRLIKPKWIESVFYIHGQHFDRFFLLREYVEVVSQVYQAYQMSAFIPIRWINNLFVMVLFLNCVSTPIIHRLVSSSNVPLRRLVSVLCSSLLNFVIIVPIPKVICIDHQFAYMVDWRLFITEEFHNNEWYSLSLYDNDQPTVTRYKDYLATWTLHWSQFSCLVTLSDLICRRRRRRACRIYPSCDAVHQPLASSDTSSSIPARVSFLEAKAPNGLWIIGLIVLAIQVAAQWPARLEGCKLQSTRWFVTESACAILNVNCYRLGIEGNEQELDEVFAKVSGKSLFQLTLSHCPRLQIPPSLRKFNQLVGLDLFNVTLDKWRTEAGLSGANHPKMLYFATYLTKMSAFPDGLVGNDFPPGLTSIYFVASDLPPFPDNLETLWSNVNYTIVDFDQLEQFPVALVQIPSLSRVSLVSNRIHSLSDAEVAAVFGNGNLQTVALSRSLLQSLPREFNGDLNHLEELDLEYTELTEIPGYIRDWFLRKNANSAYVYHSLYGSPYCNVTLAEEDQEQLAYQSQVCGYDHGTADSPWYYEWVVRQHPL